MYKELIRKGRRNFPKLAGACFLLITCSQLHAQEHRTFRYDEDGNRVKRIEGNHKLSPLYPIKPVKIGDETVWISQYAEERQVKVQRLSPTSVIGKVIIKKGEEIKMEYDLGVEIVTLDFNNHKLEELDMYIIIGEEIYSTTIKR